MNSRLWQPVAVGKDFIEDPRGWLAAHMHPTGMPFLLAHAYDGVIWGNLQDSGALVLSSDAFDEAEDYPSLAVPLTAKTLQQARLFGPAGELLLWRSDEGLKARLIDDGPEPSENTLSERHLLWGESIHRSAGGFTVVVEGQRGITQALPSTGIPAAGRAAISVRHYIDFDDQDQAYIAMSRLVDFIRR